VTKLSEFPAHFWISGSGDYKRRRFDKRGRKEESEEKMKRQDRRGTSAEIGTLITNYSDLYYKAEYVLLSQTQLIPFYPFDTRAI